MLMRGGTGSHGGGAERDQELGKEVHCGETSFERETNLEALRSPMVRFRM